MTESIDFESSGRYFSFGEANGYGGYIDDFRVFVTPSRYNTSIVGEVNALPNTTYQIEFFENDALDSSGHGEGQTVIHTTLVTTDASGTAPYSFNLTTVPPGTLISANATDAAGNTSEFSEGIEVRLSSVVADLSVATANGQYDLRQGDEDGTTSESS